MYDRILVPTDGSDVAAAAAETALDFATRFDATLHTLYVREADEPLDEAGRTAAEDLVARAREAGLEATAATVPGDDPVHRAILDYAADNGVDCVVMGTYGRTGIDRFVLGSVAERTLRESPVPVVTVHEETRVAPEFDALLVPTDGSDGADAAADHAIELASLTGAELHAVHAVDVGLIWDEYDTGTVLDALEAAGERAVESVADRARDAGVEAVQATVVGGPVARSIADYADEHDVAAVVMGTHGRTGLERYFLGSVTERVVRLTDAPVVTVKPPGESA